MRSATGVELTRELAFRFALDPSDELAGQLWRYAGAARFAWNQALGWVRYGLTAREWERELGAEPWSEVPWSAFSLINAFNAWKNGRATAPDGTSGLVWKDEVCQDVFECAMVDLGQGLANWSESRSGKREGRRVGFPRHKSKKRSTPSFRLRNRARPDDTQAIRVVDHHHVRVPGLGVVKHHGSNRQLRRMLDAGRRHAARRLARLHARVANLRRDALHQLTHWAATNLAEVTVEDLNVIGMLANHRLARCLSDAGLAELRRQLTYKARWYGTVLHEADRWYPSSKTCSACGHVHDGLTLADTTWACPKCEVVHDRDHNAAVNLARWPRAHPPPETMAA